MGIPHVLLWATPAPQCQVQPLNTLSAAEPSAVTAARAASWVPPNAVLPASRHAEEAQRLAGAQAESRASRRIQVPDVGYHKCYVRNTRTVERSFGRRRCGRPGAAPPPRGTASMSRRASGLKRLGPFTGCCWRRVI